MKWENRKTSTNVEDRRAMGGGAVAKGGGIVGVIVMLIGAYYGVDLSGVVGMMDGGTTQSSAPYQASQEEETLARFAATVLAETEETWGSYFAAAGAHYQKPKLVLYRGSTPTACGSGQSAMGPFYCPGDQKVYLDLSFYDDMRKNLQADGDFAFAYVIAHEVGHHVQNLLGISEKTQAAQRRAGQKAANQISVLVELQADCFAGIWARSVQEKQLLEMGDAEEAFRAAEAVGDDRLQSKYQGQIVPDSFTHGSSAQRLEWFRRGLNTGDVNQCNTFNSI